MPDRLAHISRKPASPRKRRRQPKSTRELQRLKAQARLLMLRLLIVCAAGLACYFVYDRIVAPYAAKWRALYGNEAYPEGYSIHGIDVSHHQGQIDWNRLSKTKVGKDAPVSFVFVKATEGKDFLDDYFNENFYQAREYGMLRGAYHYFKPDVDAREQAEYYLRQVHLEEGDLPPVLDVEEIGDLTPEELRKATLTWMHIVEERYGVHPILYTYYKFRRDYLNTKEFDKYPYWIAHYYVPKLSYKGAWKFWQHTDRGQLEGIQEKVDLNIYNGSMYDLKKLCIEE